MAAVPRKPRVVGVELSVIAICGIALSMFRIVVEPERPVVSMMSQSSEQARSTFIGVVTARAVGPTQHSPVFAANQLHYLIPDTIHTSRVSSNAADSQPPGVTSAKADARLLLLLRAFLLAACCSACRSNVTRRSRCPAAAVSFAAGAPADSLSTDAFCDDAFREPCSRLVIADAAL